ncbi:MAG TPA: MdtA/MuxA family multidrug efflux RND transporter periplasmic adaptor subunit [Bryobacteraceae bacterium]|nr:MdtA/MuxA family multidrug efflux RND transporter periplasmic adaptor subunit [Bryobacteraceae bacterium]
MITNTTTTDLKNAPSEPILRPHEPEGHLPPAPPPHTVKKPKKRGFIWMFILLAVVGVTVFAVVRASKPGLVAQPQNGGGRRGGGARGAGLGPQPVVVTKVKTMNVPVYLTGLGNVSAYYTVTVKSRVDGQLMRVNFKEGDTVKAGDELAQIDPRPYQVQLEQAQGQLAKDSALLTNAKLDLARYQTLLAEDAIPKQQLDTQIATVGQDEGNIKTDMANISNANLQLTYATVVSPITGRVGLRLVDPGNIVHASDASGLIVITQIQPISVFFTIPEDSLPQVLAKLRAGAHLATDAFNRDSSQKIASGTLLTVDNQIDNTTGTSKLKAVFENKDNALFPNQFVNIRLLVATKPNQVVVPSEAIQHGQQGPFVFLVDENSKVKMQNVQPDIVLDNDLTSISAGLQANDPVVTDGTDRLQTGTLVRVRRPGEDPLAIPGGGRGRNRSGKGTKVTGAADSAAQGGGGRPGSGMKSGAADTSGQGTTGQGRPSRGQGQKGGVKQ